MFYKHELEATLQILYQTDMCALFYSAEKTYEPTLKKMFLVFQCRKLQQSLKTQTLYAKVP